MRYPPIQPVLAMPIATATKPGSTVRSMVIGMKTPFNVANTASSSTLSDTGGIARVLTAFSVHPEGLG